MVAWILRCNREINIGIIISCLYPIAMVGIANETL